MITPPIYQLINEIEKIVDEPNLNPAVAMQRIRMLLRLHKTQRPTIKGTIRGTS